MASRFISSTDNLPETLPYVSDEKMKISLGLMMDRWNEFARNMIYQIYNDAALLYMYKQRRDMETYQHGGKDKVRRLVVQFPHPIIYDFCRAIFEPEYGKGWELNPKVLRHELISPWLTMNLK